MKTREKKEKAKPALKKGIHEGHRLRMYEKVLRGEKLYLHEQLEILLFFALPRKNTNEIAHRLIERFGSFPAIVNASTSELMEVEGIGEAGASFLRIIGRLSPYMQEKGESIFPSGFQLERFAPYAKYVYQFLKQEVLDVYLLNADGEAFDRRRYYNHQEGKIEVQAQWLQEVLSEGKPSGIVLVHNHPSGNAQPSKMDDFTTEKCQYLCNNAGVVFCNHIIYSNEGLYGYYESGQLKRISEHCAKQNKGNLKEGKGK